MAREKINDGYRENKALQSEKDILHKLKFAKEVAKELKLNVVQAKEDAPGIYSKLTLTLTWSRNQFIHNFHYRSKNYKR